MAEAQTLGINVKPVLIGPLTYLYLGKEKHAGLRRMNLLPKLIPVYCEILVRLKKMGVEWVQIDEPVLALDLPREWVDALESTYAALSADAPKLLLATYFDSVPLRLMNILVLFHKSLTRRLLYNHHANLLSTHSCSTWIDRYYLKHDSL